MRLFPSSSAIRTTRNSQKLNLAFFAGTFVPLAIVTTVLWLVMLHQPMPVTYPRPESDDYYLAFNGSIALDHRVLFHGEYDTPKYLKAAEVLLLGNSRLMFGFPQDPFQKLFQRFGMTYYMLGFGHAESDLFPLELIRKFDLHPKVVIVNADHFFVGARSGFGERVIHETHFEARKQLFEGESTRLLRSHLHRYLPHWLHVCQGRLGGSVYRSRSDGTWFVPDIPRRFFTIPNGLANSLPPILPYQLELASQFKAEMEQRGARVILTFVPSEQADRESAEQFAKHLNVPLISPRLQGLETLDHSHLTPQSAQRFTAAFLEELQSVLMPATPLPSEVYPAGDERRRVSGRESDVAGSARGTVDR